MSEHQLVRYDTMCRAIEAAHTVDEVKDIRDRAVALETYARQAKNKEAEDRCREIRERAEARWAELYAAGPKAKGNRNQGDFGGRNELPPNDAADLATLGVSKTQAALWQEKAAIKAENPAEYEGAIKTGTINQLVKNRRRKRREAQLGDQTTAAAATLGRQLYNVIYADPPWRFEPYSRATGMDRAADNHYPTMTLADLKALKIPAAEDCALFLWATAPMLPQALEVVAAWGFAYKTHCIWVKDRIGTGYWFRGLHELLLVATKGAVPAPHPAQRLPSVFNEPAGKHSAKPPAFAEFIELWFPNLPRIELFARQPRPGWQSWGNEIVEAAE